VGDVILDQGFYHELSVLDFFGQLGVHLQQGLEFVVRGHCRGVVLADQLVTKIYGFLLALTITKQCTVFLKRKAISPVVTCWWKTFIRVFISLTMGLLFRAAINRKSLSVSESI
jgi:hypothetical protein